MSVVHRLTTPLDEEKVRCLKMGDTVYLDGEIISSAGLPTYQRMLEYIERGQEFPINMENAVLVHLARYCQDKDGKYEILYVNPTTSTRFNAVMPTLVRKFKLRALGGKGGLDQNSVEAFQEVGCVYLSFLGGSCAVYTPAIKEVISVGWTDLPFHYWLVRSKVAGMGPMTVAIDSHGNSIYEGINADLQKRLPGILKDLAQE